MREGRNLVGVDIGTSGVKVCQIKESRKGLGLVRLGFVPLRPQVIVDGQVMDAGAVSDALEKALSGRQDQAEGVRAQRLGPERDHPQDHRAHDDDGGARRADPVGGRAAHPVRHQGRAGRLPGARGAVPRPARWICLLVAAKRDQIEDYAQLARNAQLKPVICDIDAFTVQNLFETSRGLPSDQTIAMINVGASLSSLNIVSNGVSAFTREIANGGNAITEEIQKQLGVPFDQAEAYKCGTVGDPNDPNRRGMIPQQVVEVIEAVTDSIAAEISAASTFTWRPAGRATSPASTSPAAPRTSGHRCSAIAAPLARRRRALVAAREGRGGGAGGRPAATVCSAAAQLSVALGLAMRKEREVRA